MAQLRAPAPSDPPQGEGEWPGRHWTESHSPLLSEDIYFRCGESPDASEGSSTRDAGEGYIKEAPSPSLHCLIRSLGRGMGDSRSLQMGQLLAW